MTAPLEIRRDRTAVVLRKAAKAESDTRIARRMLAIANALDGMSRQQAACAAGMDRQTLRDWVLRYNAHGLDGLADQPRETLLWESLKARQPGPHCSGKTAIMGHTSQKSGEILELGYAKCIDTRCYDQGWLTALDVESGQVWQADKRGERRKQGLGIRD